MAHAHVAVVKQEQEEIAKQQQQWQVSGTTIINADGEELQSRKRQRFHARPKRNVSGGLKIDAKQHMSVLLAPISDSLVVRQAIG